VKLKNLNREKIIEQKQIFPKQIALNWKSYLYNKNFKNSWGFFLLHPTTPTKNCSNWNLVMCHAHVACTWDDRLTEFDNMHIACRQISCNIAAGLRNFQAW